MIINVLCDAVFFCVEILFHPANGIKEGEMVQLDAARWRGKLNSGKKIALFSPLHFFISTLKKSSASFELVRKTWQSFV